MIKFKVWYKCAVIGILLAKDKAEGDEKAHKGDFYTRWDLTKVNLSECSVTKA